MIVSWNNECTQINIFINGKKLKQRDQFKYLLKYFNIKLWTQQQRKMSLKIAQAKKKKKEKDFSENEINTNK